MNTIKDKWEKNKKVNLDWWKAKLPTKASSFNHGFKLYDYFKPMIGDKKEVAIADLGAGIISSIGNLWPEVKVYIYSSDIWTDEYAEFYKHYGIKQFIPMEKQDMERLTYKDKSFDIVHCANSLDHCINPFKALKEMYRVCKSGGWIYLRHLPHEGISHRYMLQHQWNIEKKGKDCIIWNYQDKFMLSDCIKGFKTIEKVEFPDTVPTIVSKLHKT